MKRITSLFILLLAGISAWAGPVTRDQARAVAQERVVKSRLSAPAAAAGVALAPTTGDADLTEVQFPEGVADGLYVFNVGQSDGFVIVSSDDRTHPVLGYSTHGHLDPATAPAPFMQLLGAYSDQLALLSMLPENASTQQRVRRKALQWQQPAIDPLVEYHFNQNPQPYNMYMPVISDTLAPTGCLTVAFAQVVAHWQWPKTIQGWEASFQISGKDTTEVLADWDINWNNILTDYGSSNSVGTTAQKQEVGKLMKYVAYSLNMNFGTNGSGAELSVIGQSLVNHFGYKDACKMLRRNNFSLEDWSALLYAELAAGRPVFYRGQRYTENGGVAGHGYIVDGYDGESLWHVNWGWGNNSWDGYYDIDVLNPQITEDLPGFVAGREGYVYNQSAFMGVEPDYDGDNEANPYKGKLTAEFAVIENSSCFFWFKNYNMNATTNTVGFALVDDDWNIQKTYTTTKSLTIPFCPSWDSKYYYDTSTKGWNTSAYLSATPSSLGSGLGLTANGTYKVAAVCKREGNSEWELCEGAEKNYFTLTRSGSSYTVTPHPVQSLDLVSIQVVGDLTDKTSQEIQAVVKNTGDEEFTGNIYFQCTSQPDDSKFGWHQTWVSIQPGEERLVRASYLCKVGDYTFSVKVPVIDSKYTYESSSSMGNNKTYNTLYEGFSFTIEDGSGKSAFSSSSITPSLTSVDNSATVSGTNTVYSLNEVSGTATFNNKAGLRATTLVSLIVELRTTSSAGSGIGTSTTTLAQERILCYPVPGALTIPFHFKNLSLKENTNYYIHVRVGNRLATTRYASTYSTYRFTEPISATGCAVENVETESGTSYLLDLGQVAGTVTLSNKSTATQTNDYDIRLTTATATDVLAQQSASSVTLAGSGTATLDFSFGELTLQAGTQYYVRVYKGSTLLASYPYTGALVMKTWDQQGNVVTQRIAQTSSTSSSSKSGVSMKYNNGWSTTTVTGTVTTQVTTTTYNVNVGSDVTAVDLSALTNILKTTEGEVKEGTVTRSGSIFSRTYSRTDTQTKTTYALTLSSNPNCLYYVADDLDVSSIGELAGKNVVQGGQLEKLSLQDGYAFFAPVTFTAAEAEYVHTFPLTTNFTGDGWMGFVLPFSVPATGVTAGGEQVKWFTSATDKSRTGDLKFWAKLFTSDASGQVNFGYAKSQLDAGRPYIVAIPGTYNGKETWSLSGREFVFRATQAEVQGALAYDYRGTAYTFVGTPAPVAIAEGYVLNATGSHFEAVSSEQTVPAFSAYFLGTDASARALAIGQDDDDQTVTAINTPDGISGGLQADPNAQVFNLGGQRIAQPARGLNIIRSRQADGTVSTRKVLKK